MNTKRFSFLPFIPRYTLQDMQEVANVRGGKCLSSEYKGFHNSLLWRCKEGHSWRATPAIVMQGGWCVRCLKDAFKKEQLEKLQRIANRRGGICLSEKYINNRVRLKWQCSEGHTWETTPKSVFLGSWCPECARLKSRHTLEDMKKVARQRGGQCLSKKYVNNTAKLKWQCEEGHIWQTAPAGVLSGNWCPVCAQRARGTIEELQQIAAERGGKCLSAKYLNNKAPIKWQCEKGHQWKTIPTSVKRGTWCPVCSIEVKRQNIEKWIRQRNIE